jgi:DNA/RNA-binding protein KIN17
MFQLSGRGRNQGRKSKLRWNCELCGVACKDENGFKCHLQHENHLRREMEKNEQEARSEMYDESSILLRKDAAKFWVDDFSRKFERDFMKLMVEEHLNQVVKAHNIYEELIPGDRAMKMMGRTCWETLGRFASYLRESGKVSAERGEDGWELTVDTETAKHLLDETIETGEEAPKGWNQVSEGEKYDAGEKRSEEVERELLQGMIAAAQAAKPKAAEATERVAGVGVKGFSLSTPKGGGSGSAAPGKGGAASLLAKPKVGAAFGLEDSAGGDKAAQREAAESRKRKALGGAAGAAALPGGAGAVAGAGAAGASHHRKKKLQCFESGGGGAGAGKEDEEESAARAKTWARVGMVVKVVERENERWHKRKGEVLRLRRGPVAEIEATDASGERGRVECGRLETVIPAVGHKVQICSRKSEHNGEVASLCAIHVDRFCADVKLADGTIVKGLAYEWICKTMHR